MSLLTSVYFHLPRFLQSSQSKTLPLFFLQRTLDLETLLYNMAATRDTERRLRPMTQQFSTHVFSDKNFRGLPKGSFCLGMSTGRSFTCLIVVNVSSFFCSCPYQGHDLTSGTCLEVISLNRGIVLKNNTLYSIERNRSEQFLNRFVTLKFIHFQSCSLPRDADIRSLDEKPEIHLKNFHQPTFFNPSSHLVSEPEIFALLFSAISKNLITVQLQQCS